MAGERGAPVADAPAFNMAAADTPAVQPPAPAEVAP